MSEGSNAAYAVVALLAVAMGLRNATVRTLAVPDLTTTVLTLTLTAFAAELGSGGGTVAARRAAAVTAMLAGAVAGALMVTHSLAAPLAVAAAIDLAAVGFVMAPRPQAGGVQLQ